MTSYLLLRNNKESGPYSLEDLVRQGLKAYDLVWVKDKSAAWRYPGEIPELQEFAPPVEEQPYDRFFKKPAETRAEHKETKTEVSKEEVPQPRVQTPAQPTQPGFTPKKSVFVTLPRQKQQAPLAETTKADPYENYQQYQPAQKLTAREEVPTLPEQTITIKENPVAAEIKYSQPLDEIKEMYVKTLQDRRQRIATKNLLIQTIKKVAVVLVIVGAGVVIGFTLKSRSATKPVIAGESVSKTVETIQPAETENSLTNNQPQVPPYEESPQTAEGSILTGNSLAENKKTQKSYRTPAVSENVYEQQLPVKPRAKEQAKEQAKEKEITRQEKAINLEEETTPGSTVDSRTGERVRKQREATNQETIEDFNEPVAEEKPEPRKRDIEPKAVMSTKSLARQVSVKSNNYKIVAFGGIRDLQLTVYNDSKYILDNVSVELHYLKPSGEPTKSQMIQFRSISPNGSMSVRMPDTNRGVKISYRIVHVLSTQMAKELAGL